jgi:hypothetical protein
MQSALNLAALEHRRNLLLERLLLWPQFLWQTELYVEITVVDGAQLPRQCADA